MCYAYTVTTNVEALRRLRFTFKVGANIGNMPPLTGVYPGTVAPIIRNQPGFRELVNVWWGMPTSSQALYQAAKKRANRLIEKEGRSISPDEFAEMVANEPDKGTHNVRNTDSKHWQRWLAPEFRCIVPFNSFAEFSNLVGTDGKKLGHTWFAFDPERPLAFFAGIWAPQWTSVRRIGQNALTSDLFAFLTTDPNDVVAVANPDAMPVILRTPEEIETWMTAPWEEARKLQRPLPPGVLQVVSIGPKEDPPPPEAELPGVREPTLF
jgi:putative SOS response-associated peptidase YedK